MRIYTCIRIECLFRILSGPITYQTAQTNYHATLRRGFQFVCTAWCVIGPTTSKISIQFWNVGLKNVDNGDNWFGYRSTILSGSCYRKCGFIKFTTSKCCLDYKSLSKYIPDGIKIITWHCFYLLLYYPSVAVYQLSLLRKQLSSWYIATLGEQIRRYTWI